NAAQKFLNSLTPKQKQQTVFPFDSKERTNWNFVPMQDKQRNPTRKGLRLEEMTEKQKEMAIELVAAGTSKTGKNKAVAIMALESILKEIDKGNSVRNPEWYFVTIFGEPSKTGKW